MKYLICIFLYCMSGNIASAQNDIKAKRFISSVITQKGINYQDSIGRFAIYTMRKALDDNTGSAFYKLRKDSVICTDSLGNRSVVSGKIAQEYPGFWKIKRIVADSLILTPAEKEYIYKEIDKMKLHTWDKGLLENSTFISTDTVTKMFKDRIYPELRSVSKKDLNKRPRVLWKVYSFSVPVFLRNDSFCFFYNEYKCGMDCGQGEFDIYKKENAKWVKWEMITYWMP